ncbi:MAG: DUF2017 domain-containing protein [Streptosporangiaceae bacterium]|jgi:hypothetical protein
MEIFRPTRDGGAAARIDAAEAVLLRDLISQVMGMIIGDRVPRPKRESAEDALADIFDPDVSVEIPEDPVLARLLPDAYPDDPDAAKEFRRYTESSLRDTKRESAQILLDTLPTRGGKIKLSGDQARAWLRALNDVRLTFGTRLNVTEDYEDQLAGLNPEDPAAAAFEVYGWLGAVQSSLVQALM